MNQRPSKETESRAESSDFARDAQQESGGLLRDLWDFVRNNKKWWLTPIIIVLILVGLFVALSSSALAPFIYPLF